MVIVLSVMWTLYTHNALALPLYGKRLLKLVKLIVLLNDVLSLSRWEVKLS